MNLQISQNFYFTERFWLKRCHFVAFESKILTGHLWTFSFWVLSFFSAEASNLQISQDLNFTEGSWLKRRQFVAFKSKILTWHLWTFWFWFQSFFSAEASNLLISQILDLTKGSWLKDDTWWSHLLHSNLRSWRLESTNFSGFKLHWGILVITLVAFKS